MATKNLEWIAWILVIIGGVNYGLRALNFDVLNMLFSNGLLGKIVYGVIGISALYLLFTKRK